MFVSNTITKSYSKFKFFKKFFCFYLLYVYSYIKLCNVTLIFRSLVITTMFGVKYLTIRTSLSEVSI